MRLTYLDGLIEFMTIGEPHEMIKVILSFLLQLYLCEVGIEYVPVGSATREVEGKKFPLNQTSPITLARRAIRSILILRLK